MYNDGGYRSVDVVCEDKRPDGTLVLKVLAGQNAGGNILLVKRGRNQYLNFEDTQNSVREGLEAVSIRNS